jgi:hypothetical protein
VLASNQTSASVHPGPEPSLLGQLLILLLASSILTAAMWLLRASWLCNRQRTVACSCWSKGFTRPQVWGCVVLIQCPLMVCECVCHEVLVLPRQTSQTEDDRTLLRQRERLNKLCMLLWLACSASVCPMRSWYRPCQQYCPHLLISKVNGPIPRLQCWHQVLPLCLCVLIQFGMALSTHHGPVQLGSIATHANNCVWHKPSAAVPHNLTEMLCLRLSLQKSIEPGFLFLHLSS